MNKPSGKIPTIADIKVFKPHPASPWKTKANGFLRVKFAVPIQNISDQFFVYEKEERKRAPTVLPGLRLYTTGGSNVPERNIGGKEYHEVRQEFVGITTGSVLWTCEDLLGGKIDFLLDLPGGISIWMPPYVLHTYRVLEKGSEMWIVANTLFNPDDPTSHDTYHEDAFRALQAEYASEKKRSG